MVIVPIFKINPKIRPIHVVLEGTDNPPYWIDSEQMTVKFRKETSNKLSRTDLCS